MPDSVKQFLLEALSAEGVAEQTKEILKAYKRQTAGLQKSTQTKAAVLTTRDTAAPTTYPRSDHTRLADRNIK